MAETWETTLESMEDTSALSTDEVRDIISEQFGNYSQNFRVGGNNYNAKSYYGNMGYVDSLTAGHYIESGFPVAVDTSTSKIFHTRINDITSRDSSLVSLAALTILASGKIRFFDISDSVKVVMLSMGSGTSLSSQARVYRIAITPTNTTAATNTTTTFGSTRELDTDAVNLGGNALFVANISLAAADLAGLVISGLDTTTTVNASTNLHTTTDVTGVGVAFYSSTKVLVFYSKSATSTVFVQPPTISATYTVTAGSDTSLITTGAAATVLGAIQYGSSQYYLVIYSYTGATYCATIRYDGTTFTAGAEATLVSGAAIYKGVGLSSIDDYNVYVGYNDGTNIKSVIVSRIESTTTVNTAVTAHAINNASDAVGIYRFGKYTHTLTAQSGSTTTKFYVYDTSDKTVTQLGTTLSVTLGSATTRSSAIIGRFNPQAGLMFYMEGTSAVQIYSSTFGTNYDFFVGVATSATLNGDIAYTTMRGLNRSVTGLTAATTYFRDTDGQFSTVDVDQGIIGQALSATEINV